MIWSYKGIEFEGDSYKGRGEMCIDYSYKGDVIVSDEVVTRGGREYE
jgi:hypothetical protein